MARRQTLAALPAWRAGEDWLHRLSIVFFSVLLCYMYSTPMYGYRASLGVLPLRCLVAVCDRASRRRRTRFSMELFFFVHGAFSLPTDLTCVGAKFRPSRRCIVLSSNATKESYVFVAGKSDVPQFDNRLRAASVGLDANPVAHERRARNRQHSNPYDFDRILDIVHEH